MLWILPKNFPTLLNFVNYFYSDCTWSITTTSVQNLNEHKISSGPAWRKKISNAKSVLGEIFD